MQGNGALHWGGGRGGSAPRWRQPQFLLQPPHLCSPATPCRSRASAAATVSCTASPRGARPGAQEEGAPGDPPDLAPLGWVSPPPQPSLPPPLPGRGFAAERFPSPCSLFQRGWGGRTRRSPRVNLHPLGARGAHYLDDPSPSW